MKLDYSKNKDLTYVYLYLDFVTRRSHRPNREGALNCGVPNKIKELSFNFSIKESKKIPTEKINN